MKKIITTIVIHISILFFQLSSQAQNVFPDTGTTRLTSDLEMLGGSVRIINANNSYATLFLNGGHIGINTSTTPAAELEIGRGNLLLPYPTGSYNSSGNLLFGGNPAFNSKGMLMSFDGIWKNIPKGSFGNPEFKFVINGNIPLLLTDTSAVIGSIYTSTTLTINGNTKTNGFQLTTGAAVGNVLVSDAAGIASWKPAGSAFSSGWTVTGNNLFSNNTGAIGINCTSIPTGYKLSVNGDVRARKIRVDSEKWCDYVFAEGYNLKPIKELENFIKTYKHLPEIPSAAEVKEQGIDLADMDARLLKKVEELTLYIIELEKRIEGLEKK